jgi:cell division protein FtsW
MDGSLYMEKSGKRFPVDHLLIASIVALIGLGLVFLYSASSVYAERLSRLYGTDVSFIRSQVLFGLIALPAFFLAARIKLDFFRRPPVLVLMLLGTAALCVLPLFDWIGGNKNGASRWINVTVSLGRQISFQPSELIKPALPLYLAHYFDKKRDQLDRLFRGVLPPALITGAFTVLVILQNNFSTAMFILVNALLIFYLAGIRFRYFAGALVILLPLMVLAVLTAPHRLNRIINWWFQHEDDRLGGRYQIENALEAINAGGCWGKGLGQGTGQLKSILEFQSDFIFASFAEEAGFLGVLIFFSLFVFFAFRSYRTALGQEEPFRRLLAAGLSTMILSQTLLNIAVVADVLPTTGIPLPYFSAGGSSLLVTLIMAGLLVNLSRTYRHPLDRGKEGPYAG